MDTFVYRSPKPEHTYRVSSVLGSRVISKNGKVLGRVSRIHINPHDDAIAGVVFSYGFSRRRWYVSRPYIKKLGVDAVLLDIDPVLMHEGKKLISADGKPIGRVIEVQRKDPTNTIHRLLVRRLYVKKFLVEPDEIAHFGDSVILKRTYDKAKELFKNKPR